MDTSVKSVDVNPIQKDIARLRGAAPIAGMMNLLQPTQSSII